MNGKNKCKILKEIRQRIADENDIPYVTAECKYQGNCSGTCPRCEAELAYLENELRKRQKMGKRIAIAGLATISVLLAAKGVEIVKEEVQELLDSQLQGAIANDGPEDFN